MISVMAVIGSAGGHRRLALGLVACDGRVTLLGPMTWKATDRMTTYEIVPTSSESGVVFETWAVVAVSDYGPRRFVSRYLTLAQAQAMLERLQLMKAAESLAG
jgi:hypothetical protein